MHIVVPVTVIASFNKMKTLTSDIDLIREAMERSPLLEVSVYILVFNNYYVFKLLNKGEYHI